MNRRSGPLSLSSNSKPYDCIQPLNRSRRHSRETQALSSAGHDSGCLERNEVTMTQAPIQIGPVALFSPPCPLPIRPAGKVISYGSKQPIGARQLDPHGRERRPGSFTRKSCERLAARFWSKVDKRGCCWIWKAGRGASGGRFKLSGKKEQAHRVAWILTNGPIPRKLVISQTCGDLACCNPAHLRARSRSECQRISVIAGTHSSFTHPEVLENLLCGDLALRGENAPSAKLTEAQVKMIRNSHGTVSVRTLARRYGIQPNTIYNILNGRSWKHL